MTATGFLKNPVFYVFIMVLVLILPLAIPSSHHLTDEEAEYYDDQCNRFGYAWEHAENDPYSYSEINETHVEIKCYKPTGWGEAPTENIVLEKPPTEGSDR